MLPLYFPARSYRHLRLELQALANAFLAVPSNEEGGPFRFSRSKDALEVCRKSVGGVRRLCDRMALDERVRLRVEEDRLDSADVPKRLDPVISTLAIELVRPTLKNANVATDVRGRGPVAESR